MSAPLAASTASRKKLKAFEFAADADTTFPPIDEADKENPQAKKPQHREPIHGKSQERLSKPPSPGAKVTERKDSRNVLGYPQTPVGRVPLQELINNDGNLLEAIPNISPIERVVWNGSPQRSSQVASMLTPALRRGKRKRRPSEPVSSQLQASNHFVMDGAKAPQDLSTQALLKTPQADPVKDLWMRYSVDGPERTPITSAAVARFLNSSSPRSHDSERGLQRSLTCGSEWPTSATKRRRIDKTLTQINFNYSRDFRDVLQDKEEAARCREKLIQKINQSFTIPSAQSGDEDASGCSPTVSNEDPNHHLQDSPLDRLNTGVGGPSSPIRIDSPPLDDEFVQSFSQTEVFDEDAPRADATSLRDNTLREVEQLKAVNRDSNSKPRQRQDFQQADSNPTPRCPDATIDQRSNDFHSSPPRELAKAVDLLPKPEEDDEFGDDDDFLDVDLEAVVASYDVRAPPTTHRGEPPGTGSKADQLRTADPGCVARVAQAETHEPKAEATNRITHEISSDDEFGADSDFEELANVFTQAAGQAEGISGDAVRTVHYRASR